MVVRCARGLLSVRFVESPPWLTVTFAGELDIATAPSVAVPPQAVRWATTVVLDLTGLTFCDSRGMEVLDRLSADLREQGRDVRVIGASSYLRKVAQMAGLLGRCLSD